MLAFARLRRWLVVPSLLVLTSLAQGELNDFSVLNYDRYGDGVVDLAGRLYVPPGNPAQPYPLVVFHHGAGERGSDNASQVNSNINNLLAAAKARGFAIYAPQVPTNGWWSLDTVNTAMRMVPRIMNTYNIDPTRVYVTGLSMGGEGTWNNASNYSDIFAAAVPICGTTNIPNGDTKVANLTSLPIWAYHAVNDGTVNVSRTRGMVNAIRAAEGKPAVSFPVNNDGSPHYFSWQNIRYFEDSELRYSEYGGGDHFIWGNVYNEQQMYDWMLSQSKAPVAPQADETVLIDFGPTGQTATDGQGRTWNSTSFGTERTTEAAVAFAKTTDGRRTPVNILVSDTFANGATTSGPTSGTVLTANVSSDSWFTGSSSGNAAAQSNPGVIIIEGLEPQDLYRIELFAFVNDDDGGRGRVTRYTIGSEYRDLNVVNNLGDFAVFGGIMADSLGTITLSVTAAPGTTSRYGHLGAMMITAVPEPATAAMLACLLLQWPRRRRYRS